MILYPAIDLKDGKVVRLKRGDFAATTVYDEDPTAPARHFAASGCQWLHLVDLNGAVLGKPANADAVQAILRSVSLSIQLGGGIRDMATIETWLTAGISRVILGTIALSDPTFVRTACARYPGKIAVGIDARNGKVATDGWLKTSSVTALDLARQFVDAGVAALIYTDIDRDGVLAGPNISATLALAEVVPIPVIASGGVASLDDLIALKKTRKISGVISGRALYDGRIDLGEALRILDKPC
ncbi:MAG: 1-(5-phosphoribosyl)-5-[(5-phosphoribosylamino)methylideneamino]imidazole-4-carboxamide isomerase [Alphaproteobacteria bacterium]